MSSYQKPEQAEALIPSKMVTTVDDILHNIGWKNHKILIAFFLTSCSWIFTALNVMAESFIDDPECHFSQPLANQSDYCQSRVNDSMISDLKLFGDRNYLKHSLTTVFMVGNIVGGPILSFVSDKYGRKFVFSINLVLISVCNLLMVFADSITIVLVLRLVQGFAYFSCGIPAWILSYESIPPVLRPVATFTFGIAWVVGYCLVAPMSFFIKNWKFYMFAPGIPCLVYALLCFLLVPESLHFLVHSKQIDRAKRWVDNVSGKQFSEAIDWDSIATAAEADQDQTNNICQSTKTVLTNRKLLIRVVVVSFIWATDVFVYFGMSMFTVVLAGDRYFNFVAIGLVEVVSYVAGPFMLDKMGRRWTISSTHIATAVCFGVACLILKSQPVIELVLWLIAKFAISAAFMGMFTLAVEAFPTSERNFCLGICAVFSKIVGIFSTEIQHTVALWGALPLAIFGVLSLFAGILTFALPETSHTQLPDSTKNIE